MEIQTNLYNVVFYLLSKLYCRIDSKVMGCRNINLKTTNLIVIAIDTASGFIICNCNNLRFSVPFSSS